MNDRLLLYLIGIVFVLFCISLSKTFGQQTQEYTSLMNATILQPICVVLSSSYSTGVFFTNTTTKGVQYPITNMKVLNNATGNYLEASDGTAYYVEACSGNTIDIKVAHCACDDMICTGGGCTVGTDKLYVTNTSQGGVGWANGTTATFSIHAPPGNNYYFQALDTYYNISNAISPSGKSYIRYWIDPRPDNAPSGNYEANFKIIAFEVSSTHGTCSC